MWNLHSTSCSWEWLLYQLKCWKIQDGLNKAWITSNSLYFDRIPPVATSERKTPAVMFSWWVLRNSSEYFIYRTHLMRLFLYIPAQVQNTEYIAEVYLRPCQESIMELPVRIASNFRSSHQRCAVSLKAWRPATLLKRHFSTGIFLWILWNF